MSFNKDTFCMMTHQGFFVQPDRKVKPCCIFDDFDKPVIFDENKTFDEMYNSSQFIDLRQKMDNGIPHKGCHACFSGKSNMRTGLNSFLFNNDYDKLKDLIQPDKISTEIFYLDLRLSNLCNFKCRMCNDVYSSTWATELQALKLPTSTNNISNNNSNNYLNVLKNKIKNLKYLYLGGGEPFLMKETFQLLDLISDNHKSKISLALNTNLSNLYYKGRDILEILGKFEKVYFNVSCDGINEIGEYQRTGFETKKFNKNVKEVIARKKFYPQFDLRFTYALGAINIFHIIDFLKYIKSEFKMSEKNIGVEFIEWPWYYNIGNASPKFKSKVEDYINNLKIDKNSELFNRLTTYKDFIKRDFNPTIKKYDFDFVKTIDEYRKSYLKNIAPWVQTEILDFNHNTFTLKKL